MLGRLSCSMIPHAHPSAAGPRGLAPSALTGCRSCDLHPLSARPTAYHRGVSESKVCSKCGQREPGPGGVLCPECKAAIEAALARVYASMGG